MSGGFTLANVLFIASVAGLVAAAAWWRRRARSLSTRALKEAARELGFVYTPGTPGYISGALDGVTIDGVPSGSRSNAEGYELQVRNLPSTVSISPAHLGAPKDIRTGDDAFDAAMRVDGEVATALALLDVTTRSVLLRTIGRHGGAMRLAFGMLTLGYQNLPSDPKRVAEDARALGEAARALLSRYRVDGRVRCLVRNATGDPLASVRLRSLEALLELRGDEAAKPAFERALESDVAAQKICGAIGLSSREALRELLATRHEGPIRARALRELLALLPADERETLALWALDEADGEMREIAIEVLAETGTARAVARLRKDAGVLTSVGRASAAAIERIQSRIVGGAPGQIALAAEESAGAVSIPGAEAGAVSIPGPPKKQPT